MKIDNTMFSMYMKCPQMYWERYEAPNSDVQKLQNGRGLVQIQGRDALGTAPLQPVVGALASGDQELHNRFAGRGIELDEPSPGRDFGTRMHQLLHERRCRQLGFSLHGAKLGDHAPETYPEWPDEAIESEAQATLAAYEAHYVRDEDYLESEQTKVLPLPRPCPECGGRGQEKLSLPTDQRVCEDCGCIFTCHELVVKLDAVVRYGDGTIGPFDTKTESRPGYNTREDWAGRTQAKIYLHALGALYPHEKVSRLTVDVVSRASAKARRGPLFYRIDDIGSSPEGLREAIRNVNYVADRIEEHRRVGFWPANMNVCKKGWERCDYYDLHVSGRTEANLRKYRVAEQYLEV